MNNNHNEKLKALRHSCEHILTQSMYKLYPNIKMAMGPATDDGFYFDFDSADNFKLSPEDFEKIEKEMNKIVAQDLPIIKQEVEVELAKQLFVNNEYKQEWLNEIQAKGEKATLYWTGKPIDLPISFNEVLQTGKFVDLCAGPHIESTGKIGAFKLTKLAGAYWRGDEKNKMLTRIYGTAFEKESELKEYLTMLEEAEKRDHRKLGQELELFILDDEVGQGLPLWLPNGAMVYHLAKDFAFQTYLKKGYKPVVTPHIASLKLWGHSGHVDFYKESLYSSFGIEDEEYMLKPMNCPLHVRMYKSKKWSYRSLPLRWTEMGTVYRYERSGTLHGLTRVRGFTQDDAHIICTPEQLEKELDAAFDLTLYILRTFGFKPENMEINLSVRDPKNKDKFIGNDDAWERAENTLKATVEKAGYKDIVYDVGGAVFYGPKIDIKVADAIGRKWQLSTIQFDFNLPSRFEMTYQGSDGQEHTPFMIHRALLGSLERFMGVLIEHYAGAFPVWLSPVQIILISVGESHREYCQKMAGEFREKDLRVEVWDEDETVGNKIRKAVKQKIPYMLVIGDKEMSSPNLHVRKRGEKDTLEIPKDKFLKDILEDIKEKK